VRGGGGSTIHRLERTLRVARPRDEVFAFFADATNLEAITPPFLRFRVLTPPPIEMREGARIDYALSLLGVPLRWRTRITAWEPGLRFVDEQESGPYAFWRHTHSFGDEGGATTVHDVVEYEIPLGPLGRLARVLFVAPALDRIFDFRTTAIASLLEPRPPKPGGP
jgi:ligand-binding SRPBCC domain-containing protein